jgi:putative NADPH-quinone reductase
MSKRILIIDGHPDPAPQRYVHALAAAYEKKATRAGHEVRTVTVARIEFPALRTKAEFESGGPCGVIQKIQDDFAWCEHLVLVYPLWLGSMPALVMGLFEQILRPPFVLVCPEHGGSAKKRLRGKSVRIIVTMRMLSRTIRRPKPGPRLGNNSSPVPPPVRSRAGARLATSAVHGCGTSPVYRIEKAAPF